jgi:hypothetical protein
MNRIKALYRSRAIPCAATAVYKPERREAWLAKLEESGVRARAERLYSELDHLRAVWAACRRSRNASPCCKAMPLRMTKQSVRRRLV